MIKLSFYTTMGCHLCDQALTIIHDVHAANQRIAGVVQLNQIDIASEDSLIEIYGERIPVIVLEGEEVIASNGDPVRARPAELSWPFQHQDYVNFLNKWLNGLSQTTNYLVD